MSETPAPSFVNQHRRTLSEMSTDLHQLADFARQLQLDEVTARAEEVCNRIENEFFSVAVVGEFKRGKSTLINALLGQEILPADVLPCSATLNRVTYGLRPLVQLVFRPVEGQPERVESIGVDQLQDYVTKLTPESETRAADIREAIVYYPVKYCRDKADIIDTPGLNDDTAMTDVTLSVLPTVDAALLVILAQSPFSGYEGDFLNRLLSNDLGRVIFVVNRMDEIRRPEDRARILALVKDRICRTVQKRGAELYGEGTPEYAAFVGRIGEPKVFGVSGYQALQAKINGDAALLETSGFPAFEAALEHFLTVERGAVSAQVLADTLLSCGSRLMAKMNLQEGALQMQAQEFEALYQTHSTRLAELRQNQRLEQQKIDLAAQAVTERTRPILATLGDEMRTAAGETISGASINNADLAGKKADETTQKLAREVSQAIQVAGQRVGEKAQAEIEKALESEVERMAGFFTEVSQALNSIEMDFNPAREAQDPQKTAVVDGLFTAGAVAAGSFTYLLGGIISGYRTAGGKGALVGGVAGAAAGYGAVWGAGTLIAVLGLPVTWPVLVPAAIGVGLASAFGGKLATHLIFRKEQITRYRENFRQHVMEEIDRQLVTQAPEINLHFQRQVDQAFLALKQRLNSELGGPIEQTQKTLDELRAQKERSSATQAYEAQEIQRMRAETQRILENAQRQNDLLRSQPARGQPAAQA